MGGRWGDRDVPPPERNLYGDPAYGGVVEELKRLAREWDRDGIFLPPLL